MKTIYKLFTKRALVSILIVHLSVMGFAATYYVSNAGNDANSGLTKVTSWKTFANVNNINFVAGDSILFKKGDVFYGTIIPKIDTRGVAGNPVVFSSYGVGNNPVITGFTTLSDWTDEGNGIYSKLVTCQSTPNIITINGIQYGMGRFPNASTSLTNYTAANYFKVDSHVGKTSITSSSLNSAVSNWTGAKIVLRTNGYVLDRCLVTNHSGSTLTFTNLGTGTTFEPTNGYYFFIQHDIRTLDQFGEWFYDGTKLYVYFGVNNPANHTVKVPTLDRLFDIPTNYSNNITVQNFSFIGANADLVRIKTCPNFTLLNCNLDFSGGNGVWFISNKAIINGCSLNHISGIAIWNIGGINTAITNNVIKNTGLIEGSINTGSNVWPINSPSDDCLIQYNRIDSCGKGGIGFDGNRTAVKNNYISNTHFNLNDGGAINTGGDINNVNHKYDKVIQDNICINGYGKNPIAGASNEFAMGIYLDSYSRDVFVKGNTVVNYSGMGIELSNAYEIVLENNTLFDNAIGLHFVEWSVANSVMDNTFTNNILIAKTNTQLAMSLFSKYNRVIPFGTSDNNIIARPIDDNLSIATYEAAYDPNAPQYKTLAQWQTYSGLDANSKKSPQTINNVTDLKFEYNATSYPRTVSLNNPMIDVKGKKYSSSIILEPYTSVLLMKDNNPTQYLTEYKFICEGTSYNGWTVSGEYERTLIAKSGSDSIVTTILTVNLKYAIAEDVIINEVENYQGWTATGKYSRTLTSVSGCDSIITTNLTVVSSIIKQGSIPPTHFIPVWKGENGLNHMNFMVVSASLEDFPLSPEDEIAVFSGDSCVGSSMLSQSINPADNSTFLTFQASQDDGSSNGFTNNDTIQFKIWDNTNKREMKANAVIYRNDVSNWITSGKFVAGATAVVEIVSYTVFTQSISLVKGYNMISTYLSTTDPNVVSVTKSINDDGSLIKIQDEAGNSFENWGSFGGWINNLGSIQETEGYKIKVANNCILQIAGRPIALPLDITLKSGWNIISFPRTDFVDAMSIVGSLIDQNKLIKVQDEKGNSIENWGTFGGWKNGIGNFIPGKAYKVKMNADAVLTIQENYTKSAVIMAKNQETEHFSSDVEGNGSDHMNINLIGLTESGFSVGDELAAYDGDLCVGTLKLTENHLVQNSASLVASFSTDDQNKTGFKSGNRIQIYTWNQASGNESEVQSEPVSGQLNYEKNASVWTKLKSATTGVKTGIEDLVSIDLFPNPSTGKVTVRFSTVPDAGSRIDILDISGRKIATRQITGTSEEFNLFQQPKGIYLVKTVLGTNELVKKLIIN